MFLSKLTLSRAPSLRSLSALLDPEHQGEALDAHHRLIWSAFTAGSDGTRDFLWRRDGDGRFFTLSKMAPAASDFFETVETRAFSPVLHVGDRLSFTLRANATRSVEAPGDLAPNGKPRRRKHDVVMHALRHVQNRKAARDDAIQNEGSSWMFRQGNRSGFEVMSCQIEAYTQLTVPIGRGKRKGQPHFGIMDITGIIQISDPDVFIQALGKGFGGARSFGCGMMMIRRA